ncbi:MAG: AI-2E family transporter [Chloroflexi bacterium]|nr:AI-2E family transporter [Chloroflexota bacterium]
MSSRVPSVSSPPWSSTTKVIVALLLVALFVIMARQVSRSVWTALTVTLILAYLLSPAVTFFERRMAGIPSPELRRTIGVLLAWLLVLGILAVILLLVIPATIGQIREFAESFPDLVESTQRDLEELLSRPIRIGDFVLVPWEEIQQMMDQRNGTEEGGNGLTTAIQDAAFSLSDQAINLVGGAVSVIIMSFLVLVMLFYLMRDGPNFVEYIVLSMPESYRGDTLRLMHELGLVWNAYLRGQMLLGLSMAVATYIVALILGLPQPLLLGILAGFLEFIPNLGPTLSAIPAVMFALTTPSATFGGLDAGVTYAVVVIAAYIVIQQLEAVFLVPRILGGSLDLHPVVVLVAILIGSNFAGVLGVILAAPTVATLRLFGRYLRGKLLDEEVFSVIAPYTNQRRRGVYQLLRYFLSKRFPVMPRDGVEDWRLRTAELAAYEFDSEE